MTGTALSAMSLGKSCFVVIASVCITQPALKKTLMVQSSHALYAR